MEDFEEDITLPDIQAIEASGDKLPPGDSRAIVLRMVGRMKEIIMHIEAQTSGQNVQKYRKEIRSLLDGIFTILKS